MAISICLHSVAETDSYGTYEYAFAICQVKIYRMIHYKQEFNWFDVHRKQEVIFYETGEKMAEIGNNYGRWFYRNGKVALQYLTQSTGMYV